MTDVLAFRICKITLLGLISTYVVNLNNQLNLVDPTLFYKWDTQKKKSLLVISELKYFSNLYLKLIIGWACLSQVTCLHPLVIGMGASKMHFMYLLKSKH